MKVYVVLATSEWRDEVDGPQYADDIFEAVFEERAKADAFIAAEKFRDLYVEEHDLR